MGGGPGTPCCTQNKLVEVIGRPVYQEGRAPCPHTSASADYRRAHTARRRVHQKFQQDEFVMREVRAFLMTYYVKV